MKSIYLFVKVQGYNLHDFSLKIKKIINVADTNIRIKHQIRENSHVGEYFIYELFGLELKIHSNEEDAFMEVHEDYPIVMYLKTELHITEPEFNYLVMYFKKLIQANFNDIDIVGYDD